MPYSNEQLGCSQGDTFTFTIVMQPNVDGSQPDLTGASAQWLLSDGLYNGARVLLTKDLTVGLVSGSWNLVGTLDPADTATVPAGTKHHECRVVLADGSVSHPSKGPFVLEKSIAP